MTKDRKIEELERAQEEVKKQISDIWEKCLGPVSMRTQHMVIPNGMHYVRKVKPLYHQLSSIRFALRSLHELD